MLETQQRVLLQDSSSFVVKRDRVRACVPPDFGNYLFFLMIAVEAVTQRDPQIVALVLTLKS
jgi:hypothetical protein